MSSYLQSTYNAIQQRIDLEPSSLWFEVIMKAFRDILAGNLDARDWIYSNDFEICCNLAGTKNISGIRKMIEQALRQPIATIQRKAA